MQVLKTNISFLQMCLFNQTLHFVQGTVHVLFMNVLKEVHLFKEMRHLVEGIAQFFSWYLADKCLFELNGFLSSAYLISKGTMQVSKNNSSVEQVCFFNQMLHFI